MELTEYCFPDLREVDIVYSTLQVPEDLLQEARQRGMDNPSNPYHKLASNLFYHGGTLQFKDELEEEYKRRALAFFKALSRSFDPKHEDKIAVMALLLSVLVVEPIAE